MQLCSRCGLANPVEAKFCHFDGIGLHSRIEPQTALGLLDPPFYFPNGRQTKSYDELVLACQGELEHSKGILRGGDFSIYFRRIGRLDLVTLCEKARRNPNPDLALEEFLMGLPSNALEDPELTVQTTEIKLGILKPGATRDVTFLIKNAGQGLLKGRAKVISREFWLTLGDGKGTGEKYFQFWDEGKIHLQVVGSKVHASDKPLEGKIILDSNGGKQEISVTAEVPVIPFPSGCLQGATSPRMLAKLAKKGQQNAGALFESGEVQKWYQSNGWTYPVPGPPASGVAGIQQFFEALGLTDPPKVQIENLDLRCAGYPGERKKIDVRVFTRENRHVYAHATATVPWIICFPTELKGTSAIIPIELDIPEGIGQVAKGGVRILSNGGAKFLASVSVTITPPPPGVMPIRQVSQLEQIQAVLEAEQVSEREVQPVPPPIPVTKLTPPEILKQQPPVVPFPDSLPEALEEKGFSYPGVAFFLAAMLLTGNLIAIGRDTVTGNKKEAPGGDNIVKVEDEGLLDEEPKDIEPRVRFNLSSQPITWTIVDSIKPVNGNSKPIESKIKSEAHFSYGLFEINKPPKNRLEENKFFYDEFGHTNNAILKIDGKDWFFGQSEFSPVEPKPTPFVREFLSRNNVNRTGHWKGDPMELPPSLKPFLGLGNSITWVMPKQGIEANQTLRIVPGQQSRLLDTSMMVYEIKNTGLRAREVGFRVMLDTYIGTNDGVPFLIPGETDLCTTFKIMEGKSIPDFLQACEKEDLINPGTIATLGLTIPNVERPSLVTLGAWPNSGLNDPRATGPNTLWHVPVKGIKESNRQGDSAVALYWEPRMLEPGKSFRAGYTYGLGTISAVEGEGKLALTAGGNFTPEGVFTLTAYISNHENNDTLTLNVPTDFTMIEGSLETKLRISKDPYPITWKFKAPNKEANGQFSATTTRQVKQGLIIRIRKLQAGGIFG